MTVDKYIAIKWPHKAATYSTPNGAKIITITVFICACICSVPHLFFSKIIGVQCITYATEDILTKVYSWLTFVVNAVIPFSMLIYMNTVIVKTIRHNQAMFTGNETVTGTCMKTESKNGTIKRRQNSLEGAEKQLRIMLLLVTTLFLILLTPMYVRNIYLPLLKRNTPSKYAFSMLFYHFSHKMASTNNCINFFLYCISGQKFRNDLKEILCRCCYSSSPERQTSSLHSNENVGNLIKLAMNC